MRLPTPGRPHLTYCTNIHRGESWPEVRANVETHVTAVKTRVAPDRPFGVGLRLSGEAAAALAQPDELTAFRALLAERGLYVFTINGFPYGAFHGTPVKEAVYRPDWREDARLAYTDQLARILAELLPPGCEGSISTVPGAYKARVAAETDVAAIADRLVAHVATLHDLRERRGVTIALALEPEPCCQLETVAETVAFFEEHVWPRTVPGLDGRASAEALRRHLGVCFDACHMAVEHEPAASALAAFATHGIRVVKVQVSAGLAATLAGADDVAALGAFADDVYLHQVVEETAPGASQRTARGLRRWSDLPAALDDARREPRQREWRVHFHVPLFRAELGRFASTQAYVRELLALLRREAVTEHLEVETYTWDVLPPEYRGEPVVDAITRELQWVIAEMTRPAGDALPASRS